MQVVLDNLRRRSLQKPLCHFNVNEHPGQYEQEEVGGGEWGRRMEGQVSGGREVKEECLWLCQLNFSNFILLSPDSFTPSPVCCSHSMKLVVHFLYTRKDPDYRNLQSSQRAKVNTDTESVPLCNEECTGWKASRHRFLPLLQGAFAEVT